MSNIFFHNFLAIFCRGAPASVCIYGQERTKCTGKKNKIFNNNKNGQNAVYGDNGHIQSHKKENTTNFGG